MSTLLNKILHLPFNMLKAFSIAIRVFDWMKFQCTFFGDNSLFPPLKGHQNQRQTRYDTSPITL
jgi:hypothetical protein